MVTSPPSPRHGNWHRARPSTWWGSCPPLRNPWQKWAASGRPPSRHVFFRLAVDFRWKSSSKIGCFSNPCPKFTVLLSFVVFSRPLFFGKKKKKNMSFQICSSAPMVNQKSSSWSTSMTSKTSGRSFQVSAQPKWGDVILKGKAAVQNRCFFVAVKNRLKLGG